MKCILSSTLLFALLSLTACASPDGPPSGPSAPPHCARIDEPMRDGPAVPICDGPSLR